MIDPVTRQERRNMFIQEFQPLLDEMMLLCEKYDVNMFNLLELSKDGPQEDTVASVRLTEPLTTHMRNHLNVVETLARKYSNGAVVNLRPNYNRKRKK